MNWYNWVGVALGAGVLLTLLGLVTYAAGDDFWSGFLIVVVSFGIAALVVGGIIGIWMLITAP